MIALKDPASPLYTPELEKFELLALQSLMKGEATPAQQREALDCIINKICRTYDLAYVPGSPPDSAFLAGRTHCGQRIVNALKTPIGTLDVRNTDRSGQPEPGPGESRTHTSRSSGRASG